MFAGLFSWLRSKRMEIAVFVSMASLYFFANFQRVAAPGTVFDEIQSHFGVSATAVTALAAVFLYVYAGMQVFIGTGADRYGPGKMLLVGGALLAVGSVLFAVAPTMTTLLLCRALVGLGASFMYVSIIKQIINTFETRFFPPLLGLLLLVGYSGGIVATAPLALAVGKYGWRMSFAAAGVLSLAAYAVMAVLVLRVRKSSSHGASFSLRSALRLFKRREVYPLLVTSAINFGIYYVLQVTIGKKFLEDFLGLKSSSAALVTGAMLVTVTVGYTVGGFLPKLTGERRKPFVIIASIGVLLASSMLAAGIAAGLPAWWFAAAFVILGATNSPAIVGTSLLKEISPRQTAAFTISVMNAACYLSVAAASTAAGLVLSFFEGGAHEVNGRIVYPAAAYGVMFAGMVALALVSLTLSFFAPETRGVQREEASRD